MGRGNVDEAALFSSLVHPSLQDRNGEELGGALAQEQPSVFRR